MRRRILLVCILALSVYCAGIISIAPELSAGVRESIAYLRSRQNQDGGFSEPGAGSEDIVTCWAVLAGKVAGEDPLTWKNGGDNALSYLTLRAGAATELSEIELLTLALSESGADPRNLAGKNLVSLIKSFKQDNGRIGKNIEEHCWAIIALASCGEEIPVDATGWLDSQQREDGAWGEADDRVVRDTALAVEALVAAEELDSNVIAPALRFLRERMNADGGYTGASPVSDAHATASVIRAIVATGNDPNSPAWSFQGNNPAGFLASLQMPDGHFQFSKGVESQPALTTALAVPALTSRHFPLGASSGRVLIKDSVPRKLHDLGTAGVNIRAGSEPKPAEEDSSYAAEDGSVDKGMPAAGAIARHSTWLNGVTLFLLIAAVYAILLIFAGIVVSKLSRPKGKG